MHSRRQATAMMLAAASGASAPAFAREPDRVTIPARPEGVSLDLRRTALLVVDMQNSFGAPGGMFDRAGIDIRGIRAVIPAVRAAIAAARRARLPIVFLKMGFRPDLSDAGPANGPNLLKHALMRVGQAAPAPDGRLNRILVRDTWDTELISELRSEPGDVVLYKTRFSGFFGTELHDLLKRRGVDTLIVMGCTTSICVESTVRDAMFRDYRCVVLEDCTAEPIGAKEARTNHEASMLAMQLLFAWISNSQAFEKALADG